MGTFTLHADFNEYDGSPVPPGARKVINIRANAQVLGDAGVIFDDGPFTLTGGVLTVTLPATDNDPGTFGYTISRDWGRTRLWSVPAQAPGATVELSDFTATTPLPADQSYLRGVPGGLAPLDADGDVNDAAGNKITGGGGGGGAVSSVAGRTGAVVLTKADVGLSAVDNTADSAKPVSTAQAAADAAVLSSASSDATTKANAAQAAATAAAATDATTKANAAQAVAVQRANHTGTQSADTLTDGTTNKAFLATERTKLTGIATGATANSTDATLLARANHTGTQSADTLTDGTTNKAFLATERTKLAGVATGATANSSDATLLARANHTGTQAVGTITGLGTAATVNTGTTSGTIPLLSTGGVLPIARLATGTPDGTKFVRDDGTLVTPSGGGGVIPPGAAAPIASGNYVPLTQTNFNTPSNGPVFAGLTDRGALIPFTFSRNVTPTSFSINILTASGASDTIRLGIYADSSGKPSALINDYGTVGGATTGIKNWANSQAFTAGTTYWFLCIAQGPTAGSIQVTTNPMGAGVDVGDTSAATAFANIREGYDVSGISGAMPNPVTPSGAGGVNSHIRLLALIP